VAIVIATMLLVAAPVFAGTFSTTETGIVVQPSNPFDFGTEVER